MATVLGGIAEAVTDWIDARGETARMGFHPAVSDYRVALTDDVPSFEVAEDLGPRSEAPFRRFAQPARTMEEAAEAKLGLLSTALCGAEDRFFHAPAEASPRGVWVIAWARLTAPKG